MAGLIAFVLLASAPAGATVPVNPATVAAAPAGPADGAAAAPALLRPRSAADTLDPNAAPPSFAQVFAEPDDPALNVAYAHEQDKEGHLLAAAAAFERILLEQPDDDGVRLMYIDVLLRLDDPAGAQREIEKLDPLTLDPGQHATLDAETQRLAAATPADQAPAK